MQVMRRSLFAASAAMAAVVLVAGGSASAGAAGDGARVAEGVGAGAEEEARARTGMAEADLAHHGHASLWEDRLAVWLESGNSGPAEVADATVRLTFSVELAGDVELPSGCLRGGDRVVLCRTGTLRAGIGGSGIPLDLKLAGSPAETVVGVTTVWSGGTVDRNRGNDDHTVLVPATGDGYIF
ncbi:hypothetical protein [Streptomyces sp. FIT100]|uniref:hypothetical protein n=1 Tax=Streptomyces sp. FIT100 TaxID=2837956 RepID=UPI0021C8163A|nr:hypothetical protein [Streptomyces sp. FIT100]UUN28478.1 hypothetical protein KK483_20420 [Streptomyces sp. FIT100]